MTEGAVRYHARRMASGAVDGRSRQLSKADAVAAAITHWRSSRGESGVNLAALHDWLCREHGYEGSLRSIQRYWRRAFPAPAIRARRRVETPAGAQAQVDWAHFRGVILGEEIVDLVALQMVLSWSRAEAIVWARSKDMLSWLGCHTGCFERLGGAPATVRVDNEKTAVVRGAGAWGTINLAYRFAPRIRDLPEKRLHVFESSPPTPTLATLIARTARLGQIRAAWPQLVQLAASIRSGQVSAAHAVATLAATRRPCAAGCGKIGATVTRRRSRTPGPFGRSPKARACRAFRPGPTPRDRPTVFRRYVSQRIASATIRRR